jgi:hypothetical protein
VNTLQVSSGGSISASTQSGVAGNVILDTTSNPAATVVLNDGSIAVPAGQAAGIAGIAGSVILNARSLDLQNNSQISAANISARIAGAPEATSSYQQ